MEFKYRSQRDFFEHVADAHNAALAAERQRSKELLEDCEHYSGVIDKLEQKLAAEHPVPDHNEMSVVEGPVP